MQNTIKYLLLFWFLLSLFFLGSYKVGDYSIRNYMTLVFLLISINIPRKENILNDGIVRAFLSYVIVLVFCNIVNGEVFTIQFVHLIIAYLLPSIVVLYGVPKYLNTKKDIFFVLSLLIFFYIVNLFVTYGQYVGNMFAWSISSAIGFKDTGDDAEQYLLGSYLSGITGNVVSNGYFLASFIPISTIGLFSKNRFYKIVGYLILAFASICIFVVQQRMAFLILMFYVSFLAFIKRDRYLPFLVVIVLVYSILQDLSFNTFDTGRLSMDTDNEDRIMLFEHFFNFANSENILFGGYENYQNNYGDIQHNSFTSVVILGGIPSLIAFSVLFYRVVKNLGKLMLITMNSQPIICSLSIGGLIYAFYGMTHSQGLQNEGLYFWTLYAVLIAVQRIKKTKN